MDEQRNPRRSYTFLCHCHQQCNESYYNAINKITFLSLQNLHLRDINQVHLVRNEADKFHLVKVLKYNANVYYSLMWIILFISTFSSAHGRFGNCNVNLRNYLLLHISLPSSKINCKNVFFCIKLQNIWTEKKFAGICFLMPRKALSCNTLLVRRLRKPSICFIIVKLKMCINTSTKLYCYRKTFSHFNCPLRCDLVFACI